MRGWPAPALVAAAMACVDPAPSCAAAVHPPGRHDRRPSPNPRSCDGCSLRFAHPAQAPASPNHHSPSPGFAASFNPASVQSWLSRHGPCCGPLARDRTEPSFIPIDRGWAEERVLGSNRTYLGNVGQRERSLLNGSILARRKSSKVGRRKTTMVDKGSEAETATTGHAPGPPQIGRRVRAISRGPKMPVRWRKVRNYVSEYKL